MADTTRATRTVPKSGSTWTSTKCAAYPPACARVPVDGAVYGMKRPAWTIMVADDVSPGGALSPTLALNRQLVQIVPREDVGVRLEARRVVGDLNASVANGDAFQTTPLKRRTLVVTDKINEGADQTDAGGVYGVAEGTSQAGSTFMRRPRHGA